MPTLGAVTTYATSQEGSLAIAVHIMLYPNIYLVVSGLFKMEIVNEMPVEKP